MWDPVGEQGIVRFHGHKDAVTDLAFLESGAHKHLVSSSKVTNGHCDVVLARV